MFSRLYTRYEGREEKGGFVSGKVEMRSNTIQIRLEKIYPVKNMFRGKEAQNNYFPNVENIERIYKMLSKNFPMNIPFHYHTHPQGSIFEIITSSKSTLLDMVFAVLNQQPSTTDFAEKHGIWSNYYMKEFLIPEILITRNIEGTPLLFIYGEGTDYELPSPEELVQRITKKAEIGKNFFKEIYNEYFHKIVKLWDSSLLNKLLIGGGTVLTSGILLKLITNYPRAFFEILLVLGLFFLNTDSLIKMNNPILIDFSQIENSIRVKIESQTKI